MSRDGTSSAQSAYDTVLYRTQQRKRVARPAGLKNPGTDTATVFDHIRTAADMIERRHAIAVALAELHSGGGAITVNAHDLVNLVLCGVATIQLRAKFGFRMESRLDLNADRATYSVQEYNKCARMVDEEAEAVAAGLQTLRTLSNSLLSFANWEKDCPFEGVGLESIAAPGNGGGGGVDEERA